MKYFLIIIALLSYFVLSSQNIDPQIKLSKDSFYVYDDSHITQWDLNSYNGFDDLYAGIFSDNYNFPKKHIPTYSDSVYYSRIQDLNCKSPFNFRYNESVRAMIDRYDYRYGIIHHSLSKKKLYFPLFEEIFDKYSIPLELKYISIIESALNPKAQSYARAVGLWQFIEQTGRMYGLYASSKIDDRINPYKATEAACQFFIDLYRRYNDWSLVLAAYNAGPGRVDDAIELSGSNDYWILREYLPMETQAYVPAFIAVNYLMNYPEAHNIKPAYDYYNYYETDTVIIYDEISFDDLSIWLNIKKEIISDLNPQYKLEYIPNNKLGNILCLPVNSIGEFILNKDLIFAYIKKENAKN